MKLSSKLLLSYVTVAVLVLLVGGGSYLLNEHIKNDLIEESERSIDEIQQLSNLRFQLQNSLIFTRHFLFESGRETEADFPQAELRSRNAERAARESLEQFEAYLDTIQRRDTDDFDSNSEIYAVKRNLNQYADTLASSFQVYQSLSLELFELEEEVGMGEEMFNMTIEPYFRTTLLPILEVYRQNLDERVTIQMGLIRERVDRNASRMLWMTVLAFVVALILAWLIYSSLARPLRHLTLATEEIGAGNLDKRIQIGTNDELDRLGESFNRMAENLNRSMVSREYVNSIIQSMGDMLIVTDSEGRIKLVNRSVSETLGVNPDDLDGQQIWVLFTESESQRIREELDNLTTFGSFESCFITSDEREIPVVLSFSGLESGSEGFEGRVFVASNITDQKIAEKRISDSLKEKEVLLSEIHHRVKNNLAVISGLLEMQIWNLSEEDVNINPLKESQLRIQSIALVHELLYKSEDFSEVRLNDYVDKLLNGIAATHKQSGKSI